ncbi:putative reverse transcriptase domain-containing protein [Tanacetum coccineum]
MYIGEAVSIFDDGLRRAIEAIVVCGGPFFGDFQWRLASLPIRFGGLGLCSAEDVSTYAFVASRAQSWSLQDHILQGCGIDGADSDYGYALDRVRIEIVKSLGVSFDLSPRQKAVVECLRAPRAQNFLTVIPIEGLGQHMSALEYRTILKYRLMIPLFPVDEPCPVCRKVCLDSFGEHAVHCKELPGFKYRHDLVRDVLYDVLKRAGISSRKEAPVNFLTDPLEGRSTLRPADILVFGWAGGKHACVDLTGVSPLVGLRDNGFVAGQAALKAESSKVAKHEKACLENQHVFIPFAFDTFGFLAPEAEEFLNRVQRVVQSSRALLLTLTVIVPIVFQMYSVTSEIIEPLIPSILANLEHQLPFVRRNAILAVSAIYKLPKGDQLLVDVPEMIEKVLTTEADQSAKRNAFLMLCTCAQDNAVNYLLTNVKKCLKEENRYKWLCST